MAVNQACLAVNGREIRSQVRTNTPTAPLVMPLVTTSSGSPGRGRFSLNTAKTTEATSVRPTAIGPLSTGREWPHPYNVRPSARRARSGAP